MSRNLDLRLSGEDMALKVDSVPIDLRSPSSLGRIDVLPNPK